MTGNTGSVQSNGKDEILVKTGDGVVSVLDLQLQGKKRMHTIDFLRGNSI